MIGLKKRDIKKALKAGAKAGGMSLADVRADIEATIRYHSINQVLFLSDGELCFLPLSLLDRNIHQQIY